MRRLLYIFTLFFAIGNAVYAEDPKAIYQNLKNLQDINPAAAQLILDINAAKAIHCDHIPSIQSLMSSKSFQSLLHDKMSGHYDKVESAIVQNPCTL